MSFLFVFCLCLSNTYWTLQSFSDVGVRVAFYPHSSSTLIFPTISFITATVKTPVFTETWLFWKECSSLHVETVNYLELVAHPVFNRCCCVFLKNLKYLSVPCEFATVSWSTLVYSWGPVAPMTGVTGWEGISPKDWRVSWRAGGNSGKACFSFRSNEDWGGELS